jgi:predicted component of type VI protein secretion system
MAITLGRRRRSRGDSAPTRSLDDVAQAEQAAMIALAETLRQLAEGLPPDSLLAAEFASVARSIDAAGVLGTWRLDRLARELGEDPE